jgi:hypothetical protein
MDSNKIDIFKLEAFFAKYEFVAKYLLCCSGKFWIVPEVDASCCFDFAIMWSILLFIAFLKI